jgi:hypothetical protein
MINYWYPLDCTLWCPYHLGSQYDTRFYMYHMQGLYCSTWHFYHRNHKATWLTSVLGWVLLAYLIIVNILVIEFIILAVCKNLTQIENVSQNIVHAEIKCPHAHLAYLLSYQSYQYTNHNVCLYYWLHHSSKVRYLNKTFRPTMKNHHLLIKLLLSGQVELNPGPRSPRWPCGSCGRNVNWNSKALECDTCKTWYHTDCQGGMDTTMYNLMDISNLSWKCIKCGLPNFGSSFFYRTELSSFSTNNDIVRSNQVSVLIITSGFVVSNNMPSSGFFVLYRIKIYIYTF